MILLGELKLLLPLRGLVDVVAETARLAKEIDRLGKDLGRSEAKLANESFVARAPEAVVIKERTRVEELRSALDRLNEQRERLASLAG